MKKKIEVAIEWNEQGGFSAHVPELNVFTFGDTLTEVKNFVLEAVNLALEGQRAVAADDLKLSLQLGTFFKYYKAINAQELARRIGMSNSLLSQYVNGGKAPGPRQLDRILTGIHDLGRELQQVQFTA